MQNLAELDGLTRLNPHPNDNDPVPGIPADPNRHLVALVVDPGKCIIVLYKIRTL